MSKAKNEKLQDVITSLLADKYYFFGEFSLFINYEENKAIPTAGVTIDPKVKRFKYVYNEDFINKLSKEELRFLQMHEILHIVSNHIRRVELNEYDPMLANIAQDMIINKHIVDMVKDDESVKMIEGGLVLPTEYKGELTFDDVYDWLKKEQEQLKKDEKKEKKKNDTKSDNKDENKNKGNNGKGDEKSEEKSDNSGQGESDSENENDSNNSDDGSGNGSSKSDIQKGIESGKGKPKLKEQVKNLEQLKDNLVNEDYSFDEHLTVNDEITEQDGHNLVDEIVTTLKHKGSVPGNIDTIIKNLDVRKTKTNIFKKIKQSIERSSIGTDKSKTYMKQNRRVPGVLKGNKRTKIKFNVILDTSGSMAGEFDKILNYLLHSQSDFTLIQIDTEIQEIKKVNNAKELFTNKFKAKGFGGTRLQPAVNKLVELKKQNEACIVLTDGWCDDLDFKGFRDVIVVTTEKDPVILGSPKKVQFFKTEKK